MACGLRLWHRRESVLENSVAHAGRGVVYGRLAGAGERGAGGAARKGGRVARTRYRQGHVHALWYAKIRKGEHVGGPTCKTPGPIRLCELSRFDKRVHCAHANETIPCVRPSAHKAVTGARVDGRER
jgi:hypothetical protein